MRRETLGGFVGLIEGGGAELLEWLAGNPGEVKSRLAAEGILALRGFRAEAPDLAEKVLAQVGDELLDDAFWSTPRKGVSDKTFTATEFTPTRTISLHSEMSYMPAWPRFIAFHSLVVAEEGGATTVCDIDAVSRELGELLTPFAEKGVIYQRTHRPGVDVPWRVAYRTDDRAEVERVAGHVGMQLTWLPNDILQTRHKAQGVVESEAGTLLWFNQSNIFHPANLPPGARDQMVKLFGVDGLPRNAFYGDGSEIPDAVIREVNACFDRHAFGMPWRAGDVLLIDNMRFAHGRATFKGARKVHVAMANQTTSPRRAAPFASVAS
jgi:hypothetical protein